MKSFFHLIALIFLFSSCTSTGSQQTPGINPAPASGVPLNFEPKELTKKSELCNNDKEEECATVVFKYVVANGGDEKVTAIINDSIQSMLSSSMLFDNSAAPSEKGLAAFADDFISQYEEMVREDDAYITPWNTESELEVLADLEDVLSLTLSNYTFTGGAHGNYYTELVNFDKKTGKTISLDQLVENPEALAVLIEEKIRKIYSIPESETLQSFGFYFGEDIIPVTSNMGILKDSLLFIYNPYEVAPYALGQISVTLAKKDVLQ